MSTTTAVAHHRQTTICPTLPLRTSNSPCVWPPRKQNSTWQKMPTNYKTISQFTSAATDTARRTVAISQVMQTDVHFLPVHYCAHLRHLPVSALCRQNVSRYKESVGCALAGSNVTTTLSRAYVHTPCRPRKHGTPESSTSTRERGKTADKSSLQHHARLLGQQFILKY